MSRLIKLVLLASFVCADLFACMGQCGFTVEPAALKESRWYRQEGWPLPGITSAVEPFNPYADGRSKVWPDGITVESIRHKRNYHVRFPEAVFDEDGARKRMRARTFELELLLRWEYHGKVYAYSYYLYPPPDACDAVVDIVDDRGDGKFRLLLPTWYTIMRLDREPPALPSWLKEPQS